MNKPDFAGLARLAEFADSTPTVHDERVQDMGPFIRLGDWLLIPPGAPVSVITVSRGNTAARFSAVGAGIVESSRTWRGWTPRWSFGGSDRNAAVSAILRETPDDGITLQIPPEVAADLLRRAE